MRKELEYAKTITVNETESVIQDSSHSAGCTGVVLVCCEISVRKSEVKYIEGKLSWN